MVGRWLPSKYHPIDEHDPLDDLHDHLPTHVVGGVVIGATLGGLVVSSFGRVPKKGETLRVHGLEIEVLQSDRRRILQVRVVLIPPGEAKVSP